jgi:hypothetical protein
MVGINEQYRVGLSYLYSDFYNDKHAKVSNTKNPKSKYSKLLLQWDDFIIHLTSLLSSAIIVTPEIYKLSMSSTSYKEYESIKRFKILCKKYELDVEHQMDNYSANDLFVGGFKV